MRDYRHDGHILDLIETVFANHKIYVNVDYSTKGKVLKCKFSDGEVYKDKEIFDFLANEVLVDLSLCTVEQLQRINEFTNEKYGIVYFTEEFINKLEGVTA